MFEEHTVSVHYAKAFLQGARQLGLDEEQLLRQAFLTRRMVETPDLRITSEQLSLLARAIWKSGNDELLGLSRHSLKYGAFGLYARQCVHFDTLREVYIHLSRFYNLVGDAFTIHFEQCEQETRLTMTITDPEYDSNHSMCEFLMLMWHRFPSWLIGRRIPLLKLDFAFAKPAHADEYRLMYPCPVEFDNAVNCLYFPSEIMATEIVQTRENLIPYLTRIPFDWFRRQSYYQVHSREVINQLKQHQPCSDMDMETVAAHMNMTSRTLRRKLREEGIQFQALKDQLRRDTAIQLLSQPNHPIAWISDHLGFSDPAAFTRAFKHWTGITPRAYREDRYPPLKGARP